MQAEPVPHGKQVFAFSYFFLKKLTLGAQPMHRLPSEFPGAVGGL